VRDDALADGLGPGARLFIGMSDMGAMEPWRCTPDSAPAKWGYILGKVTGLAAGAVPPLVDASAANRRRTGQR